MIEPMTAAVPIGKLTHRSTELTVSLDPPLSLVLIEATTYGWSMQFKCSIATIQKQVEKIQGFRLDPRTTVCIAFNAVSDGVQRLYVSFEFLPKEFEELGVLVTLFVKTLAKQTLWQMTKNNET